MPSLEGWRQGGGELCWPFPDSAMAWNGGEDKEEAGGRGRWGAGGGVDPAICWFPTVSLGGVLICSDLHHLQHHANPSRPIGKKILLPYGMAAAAPNLALETA